MGCPPGFYARRLCLRVFALAPPLAGFPRAVVLETRVDADEFCDGGIGAEFRGRAEGKPFPRGLGALPRFQACERTGSFSTLGWFAVGRISG
jgi:hypothetical protein